MLNRFKAWQVVIGLLNSMGSRMTIQISGLAGIFSGNLAPPE